MFQKLYSGSFYPTLVFFIISTLVIPWIAQAPELKHYSKLHLAAVHSTSRMHRHSILVYHLPGAHIVLLCWVSCQHPNQWACFCFWLLSTFLNTARYNTATMKSQYLPKLARLTQIFLPKAWFLPLAYDFHCSLRLAACAGMQSWRPSVGSFVQAWPRGGLGRLFPQMPVWFAPHTLQILAQISLPQKSLSIYLIYSTSGQEVLLILLIFPSQSNKLYIILVYFLLSSRTQYQKDEHLYVLFTVLSPPLPPAPPPPKTVLYITSLPSQLFTEWVKRASFCR